MESNTENDPKTPSIMDILKTIDEMKHSMETIQQSFDKIESELRELKGKLNEKGKQQITSNSTSDISPEKQRLSNNRFLGENDYIKVLRNVIEEVSEAAVNSLVKSEYEVIIELQKSTGQIPVVIDLDCSTFGIQIQNRHVIGLGLCEQGLISLPDNIGNLGLLEILTVVENQIEILPDSIGNLKNLKELFLDNNLLNSLPDSIGNLKSLTLLWAQKNKLESLPESIGNLKRLKELSIPWNNLTSLPESIGSLERLEQLIIFENNLTKIPLSIGNLRSLKEFNLMSSEFKLISSELEKSLKNLKSYGCKVTLPHDRNR